MVPGMHVTLFPSRVSHSLALEKPSLYLLKFFKPQLQLINPSLVLFNLDPLDF